jgi:hypothetical protein
MLADDHGDTPAQSTPIDISAPITGILDTRDDRDVFSFDARKGSTFLFRSDKSLKLRILDSESRELAIDKSYEFEHVVIWTSAIDGTAYLEVANLLGVRRSFSVMGQSYEDDFGNDAQTAPTLTVESISPFLTPYDEDWFRVNLIHGLSYSISLDQPLQVRPYRLELIAADEITVLAWGDTQWTPNSDTHAYLRVYNEHASSGFVTLRFVSYRDDFGSSRDAAHFLAVEEATVSTSISGNIQHVADRDIFRFDARQGMSYSWSIDQGITASVAGNLVYEGDRTIRALTDEPFYVEVFTLDRRLSFYTLRIYAFRDDYSMSSPTPIQLPWEETGTINSPHDADAFTLEAQAGKSYRFNFFSQQNLTVEIQQPNGQYLTAFHNDVWLQPPVSGTYTFKVRSEYVTPYRLYIREVIDDATDDGNDLQSQATLLEPFALTIGRVDKRADVDWFQFSAIAGVTYELPEVRRLLGRVRILDSRGIEISPFEEWTPDINGPAWIQITFSDDLPNLNTTYELSIAAYLSGKRIPVSMPPVLPIPSTTAVTAWREWNAKWYEFAAKQGQYLRFTTSGAGAHSAIQIRDVTGGLLVSKEFNESDLGSSFSWIAPRDDRFRIKVWSHSTESFTFSVAGDDYSDLPSSATPYEPGTSLTFHLGPGDVDWFRVRVEKGLTYAFPRNVVQLYGEDGITPLSCTAETGLSCVWVPNVDQTLLLRAAIESDEPIVLFVDEFIDDHGSSPIDATRIEVGSSAHGQIQSPMDVDYFRVNLPAGQWVTARVTSAMPDISISWTGPGIGITKESTIDGRSAQWVSQEASDFWIEISGAGAGPYMLTVTQFADTYANSADTASVIPWGTVVEGVTGQGGDIDWFAIPAGIIGEYRFMSLLGAVPNTAFVEVTDGTVTMDLRANRDGSFSFLNRDGRPYYIRARSAVRWGAYRFHASHALDHGDDPEHATQLVIPARVLGYRLFSEDWYRFDAVAGVVYEFRNTAIDLLTTTQRTVRIYREQDVANRNSEFRDESGHFAWIPKESGTRYLWVGSVQQRDGRYELEIKPFDYNSSDTKETAIPLVGKGLIENVLDRPSDENWFVLPAEANTIYVFSNARAPANAGSHIRIFAADGITMLAEGRPRARPFLWRSDQDQEVFVRVTSTNSEMLGLYEFAFTESRDVVANGADNAYVLQLPSVVTDYVQPAYDEDWFTFSLQSGHRYRLRIVGATEGAVTVEVWNAPDGRTVLQASGDFEWAPSVGGVYFMRLLATDPRASEFSYTILAEELGNDANPNPQPTVVSVNTTWSGTLQDFHDLEAYLFSVAAGRSYQLMITTSNDVPQPTVRIEEPGGHSIFPFDFLSDRRHFAWRANRDGEVRILVSNARKEGTSYTLRLTDRDDLGDNSQTATVVTVGLDAYFGIDSPYDVDRLAFVGQRGQAYRVRLNSTYGSAPSLDVRTGAGEMVDAVFKTDEEPDVRWIMSEEDSINVIINSQLDIRGIYRLRIDVPYGDANLDGRFDSSDLVAIFQAGEFEDGIAKNSSWNEGDWNADGDFTSADLIAAFVLGLKQANKNSL